MERRSEVDHLRTFALFGIALVNMPFIAAPILTGPPRLMPVDLAVDFAIAWLCAAKFFLLFAFLFGWTFGVQERSAARDGVPFAPRFLRRSAGLLALGILHAALVFAGDILVPYALIGLALMVLGRWGDRALIMMAGLSIPLAALLLLVLALVIDGAAPVAGARSGYLGGPVEIVAQRLEDWSVALPFVLLFNGPLVFGAFCLGLLAHRRSFFDPDNRAFRVLRQNLAALYGAGLLLNLPFAAASVGLLAGIFAAASMALLAVAAPLLSAAYLVSVVELSRRDLLPALFGSAGRMSLSAYVLEGVLGGLIFIGLGLFGRLGAAGVAAIAVADYLSVDVACALWMRNRRQGPLEALLRRLTYWRPERTTGT